MFQTGRAVSRNDSSLRFAAGAAMLALLASTGLGCNDSDSPTETPDPVASVRAVVTFVQPGALGDQEETIRNSILATVDQAAGSLNFGQLMISVSVDPGRSIPGWGLGGYTLGPSEIEIVVDPGAATDAVIQERLAQIVAHEIHHTVRWRSPGPYGTLLDALVFEGMADQYANQLLGVAPAPWSQALSPPDVDRFLAQAEPQFDNGGFDFGEWFLGFGDKPRWTGYTLGYEVVGDYLRANPDTTPANLVNEPTESFRP